MKNRVRLLLPPSLRPIDQIKSSLNDLNQRILIVLINQLNSLLTS